jgi:hypothetical protein
MFYVYVVSDGTHAEYADDPLLFDALTLTLAQLFGET